MDSTISLRDQEHEKSHSQRGFYEKGVLLDSPDEIEKSETPELPHSLLTELPLPKHHSKPPSFVLPSLDENSKAPTPTPSPPSSRRSSTSEFLGALPSHEQLRRFSIASTKTDSTYHTDSQRTSPFQSGASSKVQSPLITGRKGSVSSILKGDTETSSHVDYQSDPFTSLSIGPSATSILEQREGKTPTPGMIPELQGHPDLSSFVEMTSHSPYAYVPVSSYWPYSGVPYSVLGATPHPFYLSQPSPQHGSLVYPEAPPKKQSRRKNKKKDSLKRAQSVEKETQPLSQAPTPAGTPKATSLSAQETKIPPIMLGTPRGPLPSEFDGFQDDYLEDSEYKYKTAICRSHLATGYCEYGPACQYAHGVQELRPRDFDVKFKTELCKNYHAMGMCWFGSRCRFIHDEYRLQAGENEFWLVAPSENLVRIELVEPENTARKKLLQSLVSLPPRCFPKPWESHFREYHEIPPQLAQLSQFQLLTQQFQLPVPPTSIPIFPLPPSTASQQHPQASMKPQQLPQPQLHPQPQQPILSHTAPAFVPGQFAPYLTSFIQSQPQPATVPTQGVAEVYPTTSMAETGPKAATKMEIPREQMNPMSLWHLTQNPATPTLQLHNNFPIPASAPILDPREGPKFSLFTTSSTVRAPPPPRTARDSRPGKKSSRRRKSKSKKNLQGVTGQSQDSSGRKHNLEVLNTTQRKPNLQVVDSGQKPASPIVVPHSHPPTPPVSQLTSPSSFPILTQASSRTARTPKADVPSVHFSVFESAPGDRGVPSPSFQSTPSFSQPYTTISPSAMTGSTRPSPTRSRPWHGTPRGRGTAREGRGGERGEHTFRGPSIRQGSPTYHQ